MNYNNLIIYIILSTVFLGFIAMVKDKVLGPKYLFAFKAFITVILIIFAMYIYKGKIAILFGLATAVSSVTMFDKDYSDRLVLESIKFLAMQMLIVVAAYCANLNYISCIVISLIIIFLMYFIFTHNGKVSRVKGFLINYLLLIYFNFPKNDYNELFQILFVAALLALLFYYFFNRETYFKNNNIINLEFYKKGFKLKDFFEITDNDSEFRLFVLRHATISTIAMTAAIFYIKYYGSIESIWIMISLVAMLLPDAEMSKKIVIDRIIGTIIGAVLFTVLHQFIKNEDIIYILLAVSLFFSVFPMGYQKNAVFITYLTLELHSLFTNLSVFYLDKYRIGFTILGGLIVLVIFAIDRGAYIKLKTDNS